MAGEIVMVACKLPNGVHLDIQTKEGGRKRVTVQGSAQKVGTDVKAPGDMKVLVGGYALTPVPKEHWDEWLKLNSKLSIVTGNMIFAQPNKASAESKAKEQGEIRSGFEPLVPDDKKTGVKTFAQDEAA